MGLDWRYEGVPVAYERGDWDGLRSDEVIAVDDIGRKHIARIYQGVLDGTEFCDWVDNTDYIIDREIVKWAKIEE